VEEENLAKTVGVQKIYSMEIELPVEFVITIPISAYALSDESALEQIQNLSTGELIDAMHRAVIEDSRYVEALLLLGERELQKESVKKEILSPENVTIQFSEFE